MANWIGDKTVSLEEKVSLMQQDAAYDVADSDEAVLPDLSFLRETTRAKKLPPKVPKVFLSNDCVFNCAYCGCRSGHECKRYVSPPRELAEIAVKQAEANRHGVFITSSIYRNADYTEELIVETLRIIRKELGYQGYIHAKVMPGTDPLLIYQAGQLADRLSVNIEVAKSEGYERIARNKNRSNILSPMRQISDMIAQAKREKSRFAPRFATSQTTQLMAGSTEENDRTILTLSRALYDKYHLMRVYYTPFQYRQEAAGYEGLPMVSVPKWRGHRLYQADRLMQIYGFSPEEIAPDDQLFLSENLDPKAAWALRHLDRFPVEVNRADYETLLRVPGIGTTYASRIVKARQYCTVTHAVLKALGVSLKRCRHFITCNGVYDGATVDNEVVLGPLLADPVDWSERQTSLLSRAM